MERAIEAWREVAAVREVETFLFSHGLGAGLAARLVRTYGTDVIAVLEDDPYRLTEVPRIGFRVADRVARSLGIELDAPQRLRAGVLFVLTEAAGNGNVFLPLPELWPAAARLLEVHDADPLEAALVRLASEEEIVVERERAYLTELWEAETRLAAALAERAAAPDDELFDPPARPERIEVSDEQWEIVELVRTRPLVLLTGLPGAGKTHTQRVVVELARQRRRSRPPLRADGEGGAPDARPDRPRRGDDPPRARLLAQGGQVHARRGRSALERCRARDRR